MGEKPGEALAGAAAPSLRAGRLAVAAWTEGGALEIWRVDATARASPERQVLDLPAPSGNEGLRLRLRMTGADRGWLRTRMAARGLFAQVIDGGRRALPIVPTPGSDPLDVSAGRIQANDVLVVVERARIHAFEKGVWRSWEPPPGLVVLDVAFDSKGCVWLAGTDERGGRPTPAIFFQRAWGDRPSAIPIRYDLRSVARLAVENLLAGPPFQGFHEIQLDGPALIARGDSPNLFEGPLSWVVVKGKSGACPAYRFPLGTHLLSTTSATWIVSPDGSVATVGPGGALVRRASPGGLARLMKSHFPDASGELGVSRADLLAGGRLVVRVDLRNPRGTEAQAIAVSADAGATWDIVLETRPGRGEATFGDVSWLR